MVVEKDQWHNQSLLLVEDLEKEEKVITEAMILESLNMLGNVKVEKLEEPFPIYRRQLPYL